MLRLIQPGMEHERAVMNFRQEFLNQGERISGGVGLESAEDYKRWLRHEYIPHYGKVEEAIYLAVDDLNHVVGISDIRLQENDFILKFAGQIGYSVLPSKRGRGHATEILELTLKEACRQGFDRILITCNESNIASARIIEKNHGVLEGIVPHPGFPNVRRYYVELGKK